MFAAVSSYWKGTSTSTSTLQKPVEHPLTTLIKDKVNINLTSESMLRTLQKRLRIAGVKEDHSILKEINQRLSNKALPILGYPGQKLMNASGVKSAEHTYVQSPTVSIEDTKKELEGLIGKLDDIQLCNVNDELMGFVVKNFPELKSFKLMGYYSWMDFTDAGLEFIAQFKNLEVLSIDAWDSFTQISYQGFSKFLEKNNFSSKLKELKICTFFLVDSALPGLAKYPQLTTLNIHSAWIKESNLNTLLSSPALKKTVSDFSFFNSDPGAITDSTIAKLKDFTMLEHLALGEGSFDGYYWKVSAPAFLAFLEAQKKLKTLDLRGPTIDGPAAEKIGLMNQLETLRLNDCSKIPWQKSWEAMLSGKNKLTHLDLKNAPTLDKDNLVFVANLPLVFLSLDLGDNGLSDSVWMNILCTNAGLQKTLKTLHLTHLNNFKSNAYSYLPLLGNLTALKLDQCLWFNEEALKFLTGSPSLTKNLITLGLANTSIDDNAVPMMAKFEQLKNFLLGPSPALTTKGCSQLLADPALQKQLAIFAVDSFDWTLDDFSKNIPNYSSLKTLIISNDASVSIGNGDSETLFDVAKAQGIVLSLGWGMTQYMQIFEHAIQDNFIPVRKE